MPYFSKVDKDSANKIYSKFYLSHIWIKASSLMVGDDDYPLHGTHWHVMNQANARSLRCVVYLSKPLLSVGPDSPSSRATNLRRSSVTKVVLKLMRHVNILRQAVCIRPLTGFMFSCNLCLTSLGNSLRPVPDLWWFMVEGVRLGTLFLPLWEGDRDTNQMWRHFLETHR